MLDFAKKALAFTLGVAALTTDRAKQLVDEAVVRGEMTKDEAKKFFDEVVATADKEKQNIQSWIREQVAKGLREAGAVDHDRVAQLEAKVAELEKALSKPKAKPKAKAGTGD